MLTRVCPPVAVAVARRIAMLISIAMGDMELGMREVNCVAEAVAGWLGDV